MEEREEHIKPLRLFDLARQRGTEPDEKEDGHLRQCEECRRVFEVFARQFSESGRAAGD
jgi:predicted anti-sigma-YlaC factor YlaD